MTSRRERHDVEIRSVTFSRNRGCGSGDRADAPARALADSSSAINDHAAKGGAKEPAMNCFECAKASDTVAAVGVCRHCGVGLCLDHLIEAREYRVGGTLFDCGHQAPRAKPLRGVAAGTAHATTAGRGGR